MREHPKPPLKRVPNVTVFFFLSFATLFGSVGINVRESVPCAYWFILAQDNGKCKGIFLTLVQGSKTRVLNRGGYGQ